MYENILLVLHVIYIYMMKTYKNLFWNNFFDIYLIWLFIKNIQNFIWLLIFTESAKTFNKLEKLKLIICLIEYNFFVKKKSNPYDTRQEWDGKPSLNIMEPCGEIRIYNHKTNDRNITRENGEYTQTPFLKPRKKNGCETDKGREESGDSSSWWNWRI